MPDSPTLQLNSLGGLQVSLNGTPLGGFVSAKVHALLIYLTVTGRPHSRETLIGLLWAGMPDADAKTNFRQALSNLRNLVPDHVLIERDTAEFDRDSFHLIRCCRVTLCKHHRSRPIKFSAPAAVELYQGEFLKVFACAMRRSLKNGR